MTSRRQRTSRSDAAGGLCLRVSRVETLIRGRLSVEAGEEVRLSDAACVFLTAALEALAVALIDLSKEHTRGLGRVRLTHDIIRKAAQSRREFVALRSRAFLLGPVAPPQRPARSDNDEEDA